MDKSFNVKNEPNPNYYTLESINLNMQRMELNVLKVFSNVSDRMNMMESKLDSILMYIARSGGNNFLVNSAPPAEPQQPPVAVAPPKPATTFAPNTTAAAPASTFKFSGSTTQNPPFASPQPATSSLVGGTQPKSIFGPAANASGGKPLTFPSFGISNLDKKPVEANAAHSFGPQQSSIGVDSTNDAAEESENPEAYVPDAHYEPVVPLPDKVAVVTGEESEEVMFQNRCKLYIYNPENKEIKERGVGDIKILYDSAKKTHRVVMRREQVHKICANFRITKGMNIADKTTGKKGCGTLSCIDFSEDSQKGVPTIFIVRFREETIYEEFKKIFNGIAEGSAQSGSCFFCVIEGVHTELSGIASSTPVKESTPPQEVKKEVVPVKEGFGDKFAKKEDEWDCTECYTRNQAKDESCVSCQSSKDGKKSANASFSFKPTTFTSNATTGASTFKFGISSGTNQTFVKSPFASPQPTSTSLFGTQSKSIFGSPANASGGKPLTFSALESGNSFLDKKPADTGANHSFGTKQSSTFDAPPENATEESENPEEYVPDAHYEPVVPLPDKVAVVTGEESEEILFKSRCKLYIFNSETKEVKERGVGDIKILYDSAKKTHRVVMRREQVHKICANFRITKGMNVADKSGTKTCGTFSCLDFSEDSQKGIQTVFIVRFREETVYEEFKKTYNDIAESNLQFGIASSTPVKVSTPPQEIKKEVIPVKEGFGDKFAKKEDEWDCTECYTRNQAKDESCASCQSNKDGKKSTNVSFSFKPTTFTSNATTGASTFKFGVSSGTNQTFGTSPFASPLPASTSSFGGGIGTQAKSIFGSPATAFGGKPLFSAFGTGNSFLDKKSADTNAANSFGLQQSSTFSSPQHATEKDSSHDAHNAPENPLPNKVVGVTGEESGNDLLKNKPLKPSLPIIGNISNKDSVEDDEDGGEEDYDEEEYGEEEQYDEEGPILLETDCKVTFAEAYQSPFSKKVADEVLDNVKLLVSEDEEGIYRVQFDDGGAEAVFPHYIQKDTEYKIDGKKVSFVSRDLNSSRKAVTCEFVDETTAQSTFDFLRDCKETTTFDGFEN